LPFLDPVVTPLVLGITGKAWSEDSLLSYEDSGGVMIMMFLGHTDSPRRKATDVPSKMKY